MSNDSAKKFISHNENGLGRFIFFLVVLFPLVALCSGIVVLLHFLSSQKTQELLPVHSHDNIIAMTIGAGVGVLSLVGIATVAFSDRQSKDWTLAVGGVLFAILNTVLWSVTSSLIIDHVHNAVDFVGGPTSEGSVIFPIRMASISGKSHDIYSVELKHYNTSYQIDNIDYISQFGNVSYVFPHAYCIKLFAQRAGTALRIAGGPTSKLPPGSIFHCPKGIS